FEARELISKAMRRLDASEVEQDGPGPMARPIAAADVLVEPGLGLAPANPVRPDFLPVLQADGKCGFIGPAAGRGSLYHARKKRPSLDSGQAICSVFVL